MRKIQIVSIAATALWLSVTACQRSVESGAPVVAHKLVVTGNEHSIPVYSDEQSYLNTSRMKQKGGALAK